MIRVLFRCPVTDTLVPTGIVVEDESTDPPRIPQSGAIDACTACGRRHAWWRAETVLEGQRPRKTRREIA